MKNIPVRRINTAHIEPDFSGSFSIRDIEKVLAGKDMVQELHRHDYFFILALSKGAGSHDIDFTAYKIHDHSVFFMRPGQVHRLTLKAGSKGYLMQFKTDFYYPNDQASGQLLRRASHKNLCRLDAGSFKKVHAALEHIFQEYTDKQEGYRDVIAANLGIFFIELVRNREDRKSASPAAGDYVQERLEEFLVLLETHIAGCKKISQYADMMHLSSYQLNAITKSSLGKTGSELIDEYTVQEAKRYLLATSNQVNEIAYHLGYEDISYFIRFFKKHTGYSPEAFRQKFK